MREGGAKGSAPRHAVAAAVRKDWGRRGLSPHAGGRRLQGGRPTRSDAHGNSSTPKAWAAQRTAAAKQSGADPGSGRHSFPHSAEPDAPARLTGRRRPRGTSSSSR